MSRDDDGPPDAPPKRKPVRAVPSSVGPAGAPGRTLKRAGEIGPAKSPVRAGAPSPLAPGAATMRPVAVFKTGSFDEPPDVAKQGPAPKRQAAQKLGLSAESKAAAFLWAKGYRIVDRRYKTPVGEIDIVAQRKGTIVFVEVKARASLDAAAESVSMRQRGRILDAAKHWLAGHPQVSGLPLRFDVILIAPGHLPQHLQGAFDASE